MDSDQLVEVAEGGRAFFVADKTIALSQIKRHAVMLPSLFSKKAFSNRDKGEIELRDAQGRIYKAWLRYSGQRPREIYMGQAWKRFCVKNQVKIGSVIKFRVPIDDVSVVYAEVVKV